MEINLPDYKKIASQVEKRKIEVSEGEVEEAVSWLQKSRAKFTFKSQPCQKGDFIEIDYSSSQIEGGKEMKDAFLLGQGHLIPGFEENLEGMRIGQEKELKLIFPKDHYQKDLAGQEVNFKIKMRSVQKIEFPEINDQFAKSLGNFENLGTLKKNLKQGIFWEKETAESQRVRQEILEKINQDTNFEVPKDLIELEKKQMLENLKKRVSENLQMSWQDYLEKINKTEEELKEVFSAETEKRIKNTLILREIAKKEKIEILENEIKEKADEFLKRLPDLEKEFDAEKLKAYTEEVIKQEKTLQMLESLTK